MHHDDLRVQRVITFFERLQPTDLDRLDRIYTDDAFFKDPFNEVRSRDAVRHIFDHMFRTLDEPRFVMLQAVAQGDDAFLTWEMHYRMRRFDPAPQVIRGATQLRFAPDGRVALHRDWWDAAEELYEKLPLLGVLMRWLRRRARSG